MRAFIGIKLEDKYKKKLERMLKYGRKKNVRKDNCIE